MDRTCRSCGGTTFRIAVSPSQFLSLSFEDGISDRTRDTVVIHESVTAKVSLTCAQCGHENSWAKLLAFPLKRMKV